MKLKTWLFGAGPGAKAFIQKNADSRHFLGILDNDATKLNSTFAGLKVHAVEALRNVEFDEVIITTQWAAAVKEQLITQLLVDETQIVIPEKNQLKEDTQPFYNKHSRALAREIVVGINDLAAKMQLPIVVDFGTLLGLVRDGDIIEWDDDVDFAAPQKSAHSVEKVLKVFIQTKPELTWRLEKVQDVSHLPTSYQLTFSDPSGLCTPFIASVALRTNVNGNSIHLPSLGMWYAPQCHFDNFTWLDWRDKKIQVPHDYLTYLSFQYGQWQTPKKNIKFSDYANLQEVDFEQVKTANWQSTDLDIKSGGIKDD